MNKIRVISSKGCKQKSKNPIFRLLSDTLDRIYKINS